MLQNIKFIHSQLQKKIFKMLGATNDDCNTVLILLSMSDELNDLMLSNELYNQKHPPTPPPFRLKILERLANNTEPLSAVLGTNVLWIQRANN